MTALKEEFFKSRRKHTFLIVAAFAAIELFWLLWSFKSGQKIENGWFDILYNIPVLDAVICHVLAAVTAGQNADLEHRGDTCKLLYTMQNKSSLYNAKAVFGLLAMVLFFILQTAVILLIGQLYEFNGPVPSDKILTTTCIGFLVTLAVYMLQLNLSMEIKNQFVPFAVGIVGSFSGMFLLFLPSEPFRKLIIWGSYGALSLVIMDWDAASRTADFYWREPDMPGIAAVLVWLVALYIIGRIAAERRDV